MKKCLFIITFGAFIILIWTFSSFSAEPIRIGSPLALSGNAAFAAIPEKETLQMLVAISNKAGGINGRPIEFIYYDDENKPDVAVSVIKRLIEKDKVTAILCVTTSYTALAISPIIEKAQIPTIMLAATLKIVDPVKKWVFKIPPDERIAIAKLLSYMQSQGIQRIAIMTSQDPFGDQGRSELTAQAPTYGIKIVFDDKYTIEDTDITPTLNKIKKTDAQAVVNWSPYRAPVIFTMNYRQMGLELPLFLSHADLTPQFLEAAGKNAEGIKVGSFKFFGTKELPDSDPQKRVILDYLAAYKEKYGKQGNHFGGSAWDGFYMLTAALKKAGDNKSKLRDAIEQTRGFIGTYGIFNYSPDDHSGISKESLIMYQVTGGEWKMIK